jgi:hypothetical protein
MSPDVPRYLARVYGYTLNSARAADRLECIDEGEQERQTQAAHAKFRRELQREWGAARGSILAAVQGFKASGHLDRRLSSDVRVLERQLVRIDRDVGL